MIDASDENENLGIEVRQGIVNRRYIHEQGTPSNSFASMASDKVGCADFASCAQLHQKCRTKQRRKDDINIFHQTHTYYFYISLFLCEFLHLPKHNNVDWDFSIFFYVCCIKYLCCSLFQNVPWFAFFAFSNIFSQFGLLVIFVSPLIIKARFGSVNQTGNQVISNCLVPAHCLGIEPNWIRAGRCTVDERTIVWKKPDRNRNDFNI